MLELSAETRARDLAAMSDGVLDVLVIGGGIVGAGVALDAASRELRVGLVEGEDFASGTSGRSSRMIHGGARYLQHGDVGLVYEALRERHLLLRLAPHLVRPLSFVVPLRRFAARTAMRTGLTVYDGLAAGRNIGHHRAVSEEEMAAVAPGLVRPSAGYRYWDCRTDDARLVIEVLRVAVAFGALLANRARVVTLLGEGRVGGARVQDTVSGQQLDVRARIVVNATGVWASGVQSMAGTRPPRLRPSKGVHLVLDRARLPVGAAVLVPSVARDGSLIFAVPWGPRVIAGTTDTPYDGPLGSPTVGPEDAAVVLESIDHAFGLGLTDSDVRASWAGVRSLLDTGHGSTRDISRRHVILDSSPGLIGVTGGKLTTYRRMAEQVVDRVCAVLASGERCRTRQLPLGLSRPLGPELARAESVLGGLGMSPETGRRLVERYGDDWTAAVDLIRDEPNLGGPMVEGLPVLRVEALLATRREMAMTEDDVLVRRTRLATMDRAAADALSDRAPIPRR
ncbi:MAG: glycerol-3-phosphate dehydrogenase/oxidase [Actinomycetota bacterium]|nr:glycerol-3-phosphate dehydrogenase/oxidase [Actinomycetota bacterium]